MTTNIPDSNLWIYRGHVAEVIDGDTLDVVVDVGFHMQRQIRVRLLDVDTHETYGVPKESEEFKRGTRETEFVQEWLPWAGEWPLIIRTGKTGKYGRYLATVVRRHDGSVLNDDLRETFEGVDA